MAFVSFRFIIFISILLITYFLIPKKYQWCLLLLGSYVFYAFATPYFLVFLFISTIITYICGIRLEKLSDACNERLKVDAEVLNKESRKALKNIFMRKKRLVLIICLVMNIGVLGVLKYFNFFMDNVSEILHFCGISYEFPDANWLLPLGISFYTFITVGYCIDVYREVSEAQNNIFKYALFVAFFPQISQGPINRYSEMSTQLYEEHAFDFVRIQNGGYRILIGVFKKVVVADRLGIYVDRVYGAPIDYNGLSLLFATVFYAVQIYCDFSGYMDIAIGVSDMFGIKMAENFDKPYFSKSIPEYWRRWHITLGAWFKDYLFYPVIRSDWCKKIGKKFKKTVPTIVGLLVVWFSTGLWHGASWHYVLHGLYHGTLIILSFLLASIFHSMKTKLHIKEENKVFHIFQILRTFILVDISYILFRARNLKDAAYIMNEIVFHLNPNKEALKMALLPFTEDNTAVAFFGVAMLATAGVFVCEILDYNHIFVFKKHKYINVVIMLTLILLLGMFGQSSFIYMQY